jgi:hypothetical protein
LFHQSDPEHRKKKNLGFSLTPHRWLSYLNVRIHVHIMYTSCMYMYIYTYAYIYIVYLCMYIIQYHTQIYGYIDSKRPKKVANWR